MTTDPRPYNRVKTEDLQIGHVHPRFGACDEIRGPVDGMYFIGWENHSSGWVGPGVLFTVAEGTDDDPAGAR